MDCLVHESHLVLINVRVIATMDKFTPTVQPYTNRPQIIPTSVQVTSVHMTSPSHPLDTPNVCKCLNHQFKKPY